MHVPATESDDPRRGRAFDLVPLGGGFFRTRESGLELAVGVRHEIETDAAVTTTGDVIFSADLRPGQSFTLTKFVAYHWEGGDVGAHT